MDIVCPKCRTEYDVDPRVLEGAPRPVRCTACGHVFDVDRPVSQTSAVQPSPTQDANAHEWLVRRPSGEVIAFRELTTLQKWIVEGRIGPDDGISRSGKNWKRLGSIPELEPFFRVVEQAEMYREITNHGYRLQQLSQMGSGIFKTARPESTLDAISLTSFPKTNPSNETARVRAAPLHSTPSLIMNDEITDEGDSHIPTHRPGHPSSHIGKATFAPQRRNEFPRPVHWMGLLASAVALALFATIWIPGRKEIPSLLTSGANKNISLVQDQDTNAIENKNLDSKKEQTEETHEKIAQGIVQESENTAPKKLPKEVGIVEKIQTAERYRSRGEIESALKTVEEALQTQATNEQPTAAEKARLENIRGWCLLEQAKPESAKSAFNRALALSPNLADALYGRGEAHRELEETDEAILDYDAFLDLKSSGEDAQEVSRILERLKSSKETD